MRLHDGAKDSLERMTSKYSFYFTTGHEHIWIQKVAHVPTRLRQTSSSQKQMLTIFWSPLGFLSSEFSQRYLILMRAMSSSRSFRKETEFNQQTLLKMLDEELCCASTMQALRQYAQLSPIWGFIE
jgi:hypothetical protein